MALQLLVVDDSPVTRKMVRRAIGLCGLEISEVHEASNGAEALERLASTPVDLVLADVNMPVMNGMELLREMAAREDWADILRVIISTDGSRLRREEARELKVSLYVEKPFRPEVVRDVLCQIATVDVH